MYPTAEKFGYPQSLVRSYEHWHVLVRPVQPCLGSLVLLCSDPVESFGAISHGASAELKRATADIERALSELFQYDKINYLMLMMVDPDVHFHVLPRYGAERSYAGVSFVDSAWPGPPDISAANDFPSRVQAKLLADLKARFR